MAIDLKQFKQNTDVQSQAAGSSHDWADKLLELLSKDIKLFGSSFGDKKKARFYSELHILLTSGIDMRTSLEMLEEEQEKKDDRDLMTSIKQAMIEGKNLSDAAFATAKFSEYE